MNKKAWIFFVVALILGTVSTFGGLHSQEISEQAFFNTMEPAVKDIGMEASEAFISQNTARASALFVDEVISTPEAQTALEEISSILSGMGEIDNIEIAGYYIDIVDGAETHSVVMQLEFEQGYVLYSYAAIRAGDTYKLTDVKIDSMQDSLKEMNSFGFDNKSIWHYVWLIVSIITVLFAIGTAAYIFGNSPKRELIWVLFSLCGFGIVTLFWNTGQWTLNALSVGFPVASIEREGSYAPIVLAVRFPLGAALYWIKRHRKLGADSTVGEGATEIENSQQS